MDGGLYYLHYTIHFLDMQLSLSITQSISKLPKSSTSGSFCQSYSSVSSSSSSSKSRSSSSLARTSSRMSYCGTNVAAMAMILPSWRATCTAARSPTVGILMFWVESPVWTGTSTSRSSAGRKTTMVLEVMVVTVPEWMAVIVFVIVLSCLCTVIIPDFHLQCNLEARISCNFLVSSRWHRSIFV